ncbi:MAG: hypothetical protein AB8F26_10065 [Phycisphaerales bacterium]
MSGSSQLFWFGAGASKGYTGSKTGQLPPLASEFFTIFNQLEVAANPFVRVGHIVNYVKRTRNVEIYKFEHWNENIEDFLTELAERIAELPAPNRGELSPEWIENTRAFDQMLFLFECVLNEIQNGLKCDLYSKLLAEHAEIDSIITFNWDCILDRAAWDSQRWTPDRGYGIEFNAFYENGWRKEDNSQPTEFQILKMHGSTNWLTPYTSFHFETGQRVYSDDRFDESSPCRACFVRSNSPYPTYGDRHKIGYSPFSYFYYPPNLPDWMCNATPNRDHERTKFSIVLAPDLGNTGEIKLGDQPLYSSPLMVGPLRDKDYSLGGGCFDTIWESACRKIAEHQDVTIIGYSFPKTDIRSIQLLKEAQKKAKSTIRITLVDPYAEHIVDRLADSLGNPFEITGISATLSDWLGS